MKVKELIELLQQQNPEAEAMLYSGLDEGGGIIDYVTPRKWYYEADEDGRLDLAGMPYVKGDWNVPDEMYGTKETRLGINVDVVLLTDAEYVCDSEDDDPIEDDGSDEDDGPERVHHGWELGGFDFDCTHFEEGICFHWHFDRGYGSSCLIEISGLGEFHCYTFGSKVNVPHAVIERSIEVYKIICAEVSVDDEDKDARYET